MTLLRKTALTRKTRMRAMSDKRRKERVIYRQRASEYLAAHPDGASRHWRSFTAALDSVPLTAGQEQQVIDAADAAFRSVHGHVEQEFGR